MRKCGNNIVEQGRPQMVICRMRNSCCIPKATDNTQTLKTLMKKCALFWFLLHSYTHSSCVIIIAFPLQQR